MLRRLMSVPVFRTLLAWTEPADAWIALRLRNACAALRRRHEARQAGPCGAALRIVSRPAPRIFLAASAAALAALGVWVLLHKTTLPPPVDRSIESVSYTFGAPDRHLSPAQAAAQLHAIAADLKLIAGVSHSIRTYASSGLFEDLPALARSEQLGITAGVWVGNDPQGTLREANAAIAMANRNHEVRAILVGNETLQRNELPAGELVRWIRYVRQRVRVPVSTGETWNVWLDHPELAREVDFISAHILPYWEGIAAQRAVPYTFQRYDQLRAAFPGKKVVIAEFGWPSQGFNNRDAFPGAATQANVIREFLREAQQRGVSYNVIEALDQPWKRSEGSVGSYWGLFDASRAAKFQFEGAVQEHNYWVRAALAVAAGLLMPIGTFALVRRPPTFLHALAVAVAAQALASGVAMAALYPFENYLNFGSAFAWGIGFLLMIPLTLMTLLRVHEAAEITLGRRPARLIAGAVPWPDGWRAPKVSIHIPAYREAPDMLIETLDSVAALDYPDFEVLVIVNNTPEAALWRPVQAHCARLGSRFKFVMLDRVEGFKAGALNAALAWMAADAEVIAVIDADYIVQRDWLTHLMPAFADPAVGLVQAPQDHRDAGASAFKGAMNSEYAGFFDIGMVQRNEDNAIIAHGTMLLVRRAAFERAGGWSADTITEDTELGLRILRAGYAAAYTNRRYGWGLLPDSFRAFQVQRERWVFGAVQIIRKHWRAMLPGERSLTRAQKFQFVVGWSLWFSDAFGVVAACLNLLWVPMILFVGVLIPMVPFTLPILALFAVNLLHCALLYTVRVKLPIQRIAGAALAAMSLQMTVARAAGKALFKHRMPFRRTEKGGLLRWVGAGANSPRVAWPEGVLGAALASGAAALVAANTAQMLEIDVFAATLAVQSLPFLAAPLMVLLERFSPALQRLTGRSAPGSPGAGTPSLFGAGGG